MTEIKFIKYLYSSQVQEFSNSTLPCLNGRNWVNLCEESAGPERCDKNTRLYKDDKNLFNITFLSTVVQYSGDYENCYLRCYDRVSLHLSTFIDKPSISVP